jgi:hypothetical protein
MRLVMVSPEPRIMASNSRRNSLAMSGISPAGVGDLVSLDISDISDGVLYLVNAPFVPARSCTSTAAKAPGH